MQRTFCALSLLMLLCLTGCSTTPNDPALLTYDQSQLPPPDISLSIPGLGPCTDNPDRTLHLNSQQPVTVMVHGCHGSTGRFRALAEVMAFHGQQTACFTYDDRDSLMVSSGQLANSLDTLSAQLDNKEITVVGHSQGALIARKALVTDRPNPVQDKKMNLRLVTISGPFSGIASAEQCGSPTPFMMALTLGLVRPLCKVVSGDKWFEITSASDFIRQPGELLGQVRTHLKIDTDERGTCRRFNDAGTCVESDYVFSLDEQNQKPVDEAAVLKKVEIKAGHVEIVGDYRVVPVKLISLFQQYGILNPTEADRSAAFNRLLVKLYLADVSNTTQAATLDVKR
ncbi:MAG: hydrolase [Nitrosomonadales bacterium]|nr:hydrolase [Nitrosomonadales bacterium]